MFKLFRLLFLIIVVGFASQCKNNGDLNFIEPPVREEDGGSSNIGRSSWQKPGEVIDLLGDITDKTIADVGAGTGYFSFRMAFKGANVLALEIDPDMIDVIESFKSNLPVDIQFKIESRMVEPDDPELEEEEIDIAVIVNTIAYIENKKAYFDKLKKGMKENSKLMIIDFKNILSPYNTSDTPKVSVDEITTALEDAGFQNIVVNHYTLDYQYIVFADCKNKMFE